MTVLGDVGYNCHGWLISELNTKAISERDFLLMNIQVLRQQFSRKLVHFRGDTVPSGVAGRVEIAVQITPHVAACFVLNAPSQAFIM
jgi:hypothetical protein